MPRNGITNAIKPNMNISDWGLVYLSRSHGTGHRGCGLVGCLGWRLFVVGLLRGPGLWQHSHQDDGSSKQKNLLLLRLETVTKMGDSCVDSVSLSDLSNLLPKKCWNPFIFVIHHLIAVQPAVPTVILQFIDFPKRNFSPVVRQGVILAILRALDLPLAAGISAGMIAYRAQLSYPTTVTWPKCWSKEPTSFFFGKKHQLPSWKIEMKTGQHFWGWEGWDRVIIFIPFCLVAYFFFAWSTRLLLRYTLLLRIHMLGSQQRFWKKRNRTWPQKHIFVLTTHGHLGVGFMSCFLKYPPDSTAQTARKVQLLSNWHNWLRFSKKRQRTLS